MLVWRLTHSFPKQSREVKLTDAGLPRKGTKAEVVRQMCVDVFQHSYQAVISDSLVSQRLVPHITLRIVRRICSSRCLRIFRVLCHLRLPDLRVARHMRWRIVCSWQSHCNFHTLPSVYLPHGRYALRYTMLPVTW